MQHAIHNACVVGGDNPTGLLVNGNEVGRLGRGKLPVLLLVWIGEAVAVDAVGGLYVKNVAVNDRRSVGRVTGEHAEFLVGLQQPDDARLSILPVGVEANDIEAVADEIDPVAIDGGRRTDPHLRRNLVDAQGETVDGLGELARGRPPLPQTLAGGRIEACEDTGVCVATSNVDPSANHGRRGIGCGAELGSPEHVPAGGGIHGAVLAPLAGLE